VTEAPALLDATEPAVAIAAAVRGRKISALAVAEAALARIEARDKTLNAFTTVTRTRALAEAETVDRTLAAGADPGPLAGVPYAVKNLFDIAGVTTLAGSKINRGLAPAARDATLIERLKGAGAVLLGALNMGEYAYDFTGENVHYGPSRNPRDPSRMSGGSSGGSGTAVTSGMVALSLGSDTNGSIRVPSALCGLFGLKPTFGRLSRAGSFPFVGSLDHLGPIGRSARDLALAYDALQGADAADPACAGRAVEPASPSLKQGTDGLRIAVAGGYFESGGMPEAHAAVETVAAALGVTRRVVVPEAARARAAAFVISASEGGTLHLERLRARAQDFDPATRDRLTAGALTPAAWYVQAQRFRRWYYDQVMALFREVDILLAPSTPVSAPLIGQKTMTLGGKELPVRANLGIFTQPISFIGLPVVAVPVMRPGAMPLGVQVIAAPWQEASALRVAAALEVAGVVAAPVA
jgi:AtzE family amidohydrolase